MLESASEYAIWDARGKRMISIEFISNRNSSGTRSEGATVLAFIVRSAVARAVRAVTQGLYAPSLSCETARPIYMPSAGLSMIEMDLIEIMRFLRKPNEPSLNHEAMDRRETDPVMPKTLS